MLVETDTKSTFANLLALDPDSGDSRLIARGFSVFDTAPVISMDGSRLYVLQRRARRLDILNSGSGTIAGHVNNLPRLVLRVVDGPSGSDLYFLTGLGDIYRADTVSNRVEGPIAQIPGANSMAISGDGRKLYVVGADLESIIMLDLADDYSQRLAPLVGSAYWIWADPDGPFLFAGGVRRAEVTIIDAKSLQVAGRLDFAKDAE